MFNLLPFGLYAQVGSRCGLLAGFKLSSDCSLEPFELVSAPTWFVLKNVPPQLYSLDNISLIASPLGEPLHTEKSKLSPFHFGDTKFKFEIQLEDSPPAVIVRDSQGFSVRVNVEYPRLPPNCCNCGKYGHLLNCCPLPLQKRMIQAKNKTVRFNDPKYGNQRRIQVEILEVVAKETNLEMLPPSQEALGDHGLATDDKIKKSKGILQVADASKATGSQKETPEKKTPTPKSLGHRFDLPKWLVIGGHSLLIVLPAVSGSVSSEKPKDISPVLDKEGKNFCSSIHSLNVTDVDDAGFQPSPAAIKKERKKLRRGSF